MKIAIAIWNGCVSNVFDFAEGVLLVEFDGDKETNNSEVKFECKAFARRISQLKSMEIDVIICGAISRDLAEMVTASGIELLAYVTGAVEEVLAAYGAGQLGQSQFAMPGCWPGARKGLGKCGQGRRRCRLRGN